MTLVSAHGRAQDAFMEAFTDPPKEFSVMPFWFWNDRLTEEEILRQIGDFEEHGVFGFVIHPRIGLPEDMGWLSPPMIDMMRVAIEEAQRRGMYVILYDEGMYPSGSSAGQVVERNPRHAARGLFRVDLEPGETPAVPEGWELITVLDRPGGERLAVFERPSGGVIRGVHYIGEGTDEVREFSPPAGDILSPAAVDSFIELVYDRFHEEFGEHFGETILGIFTDEPSMLGRGPAGGTVPGNAEALEQVSDILGYDFTPHLADLWYEDNPESGARRADYHRAIGECLEENYYRRLSEWCEAHDVALTGHPAGSMDLGAERYFHMPGQDLVWRYVTPGEKALSGGHSTMAKCASSAMLHLQRRRNSNELYGAYGHELTYDEMVWLAHWCLVRGQNLLYPHAFYYSVRGPRRDERPPDVGPNAEWWDDYRPYADAMRRLCWLNTDSEHVCSIAILGRSNYLPDGAAKVCLENQRDFNYLELRHLWEDARVDGEGVHLAGMTYETVILDSLGRVPQAALPPLQTLADAGRLIVRGMESPVGGGRVADDGSLVEAIDTLVPRHVTLDPPAAGIRYRHVVRDGRHVYLLFNEVQEPVTVSIEVAVEGDREWLDPATGEATPADAERPVAFDGWEMKVLSVGP
jgi:hypothetical protein